MVATGHPGISFDTLLDYRIVPESPFWLLPRLAYVIVGLSQLGVNFTRTLSLGMRSLSVAPTSFILVAKVWFSIRQLEQRL